MHYNLLFNGCSFTAGSELEGLDDNFEYRDRHRYSHVVSERLEKTYANISIGGNSNDRITRDTLNWFSAGNTCDLAIIQWSSITRHEYISKHAHHPVNFIPNAIVTKWEDNTDHEITKVAHKHYFKYYYNHTQGMYNFYKNLYILEQFFEKNDIRYFMIKLGVDINLFTESNDHFKFFWSQLCKHDYFNIPSIMNNILCPQDRSFFTKDYTNNGKIKLNKPFNGIHPNELGHQAIADYLIKEISNAL